MTGVLTPTTVDEVAAAVVSASRVLAVGATTKPRLSSVIATRISLQRLTGIVEYEPSEFTITAHAGTPVREVQATLQASGQYLPFDPMLVDAGATLGGTVSAGINGPGRFRFGGIRDFILGVQWVDGAGRALRFGGKVVKNAAGFDLPKFAVGSLGRFGVLTEITFKVFPQARDQLTLRLPVSTAEEAVVRMTTLARSQWEPDALDYHPSEGGVFCRLCGPAAGIEPIAREITAGWNAERLDSEAADAFWCTLCEFAWSHPDGILMKIVHAPAQIPDLISWCADTGAAGIHTSCGGNVSYVSLAPGSSADFLCGRMKNANMRAVTLRGEGPLWVGVSPTHEIGRAVKSALDPENRFPNLDE